MKFGPLIFAVFFFAAAAAVVSPYDIAIQTWLTGRSGTAALPGDALRIIKLAEIFGHGFGVAVVLTAVWLLAPNLRKRLPIVVFCVLLPTGTVTLIKAFVFRNRPNAYFDTMLVPEFPAAVSETWLGGMIDGIEIPAYVARSFPSGHAAVAVGLAVGMCWLLPRGRWLFVTLAALCCLQRVVSSAHWTSDILASVAISLLMAGTIVLWFSKFTSSASKRSQIGINRSEGPNT